MSRYCSRGARLNIASIQDLEAPRWKEAGGPFSPSPIDLRRPSGVHGGQRGENVGFCSLAHARDGGQMPTCLGENDLLCLSSLSRRSLPIRQFHSSVATDWSYRRPCCPHLGPATNVSCSSSVKHLWATYACSTCVMSTSLSPSYAVDVKYSFQLSFASHFSISIYILHALELVSLS